MDECPRDRINAPDVRRWWSIGLWTRLAMAGGLMVPAGVTWMADGGDALVHGMLLALAGAGLAYGAGRRALGAIDAIDREDAKAPAPAWRWAGRFSPSRRPA
jgi:hypothetical protein